MELPAQGAPPWAGAGLVQVLSLCCIPPPQVTEQVFQDPQVAQLPSTEKRLENTRNKTVHFQLNLWTFRWFVSLSITHSDMVECCSLVRSPDFRGRQLRHIEEPGLCRFSSGPVDLHHTSLYTCPSFPSLPTLHRLNIKNKVPVLKY